MRGAEISGQVVLIGATIAGEMTRQIIGVSLGHACALRVRTFGPHGNAECTPTPPWAFRQTPRSVTELAIVLLHRPEFFRSERRTLIRGMAINLGIHGCRHLRWRALFSLPSAARLFRGVRLRLPSTGRGLAVFRRWVSKTRLVRRSFRAARQGVTLSACQGLGNFRNRRCTICPADAWRA